MAPACGGFEFVAVHQRRVPIDGSNQRQEIGAKPLDQFQRRFKRKGVVRIQKVYIVRRQIFSRLHQRTVRRSDILAPDPTPQPWIPGRDRRHTLCVLLPAFGRKDAGDARHIGADAVGARVARQQIFARAFVKLYESSG